MVITGTKRFAMDSWWNSLTLALQVFYAIGIVSGVILLAQAVLTLFGMDHHDAPDLAGDHPDGLGVLSIRSVTGFFFGFGWTGVICVENGLGLFPAILIALLVGALFLFGIYLLMRVLFSMRASGTVHYANAVGQTGTVYVTIPAANSGSGQVQVIVQGRLRTVGAMTTHDADLKPGQKITVTAAIDPGTLAVLPI